MSGRRPKLSLGFLTPPDPEPWRKTSTGSTANSISSDTSSSSSEGSTLSELSSRRSSAVSGVCGCGQCASRRLSSTLPEDVAAAAVGSTGAEWREGGVAVRHLPLHCEASWTEVSHRQLLGRHPHLQACLAATHTPEGLLLLLEAAPCGDLSSFLRVGGVGEERARRVAQQVGAALQHVHARGLVHGDLQPRHILVCDRGLTSFKLGGLHAARPRGTPVQAGPRGPLAPPEVRQGGGDPYAANPAQDAWQLGLLLVACLTGALPWAAADPADPHYAAWAAWARRASTRVPPEFRIFSPRFLRLLRRLLHPDPARRGAAHNLDKYLRHPWLAGRASVLADARKGFTRALASLKSHLMHAPAAAATITGAPC
ncbi:Serine/threonine-protein kinase SBK1 [Portunus trituberculatus]|uniref:Serine/threonine-protein kinase SBK1 n=1 Tax=Portunus trituberculatus TaxID=210409 RepID=A0A5B7HW77_PORTR|nr:Serine/threonine-protein kinase SBK1 [Portunus trituberculatus]